MDLLDDEYYMNIALTQARIALEEGEVPVGVVLVGGGKIISKTYNQTEKLNDATAHAEMLAITSGSYALASKYLNDCTLYVTLEPCFMCAGATYWTQLGKICYGADDPKRGFKSVNEKLVHPKTIIKSGVLAEESKKLLDEFFTRIRKK